MRRKVIGISLGLALGVLAIAALTAVDAQGQLRRNQPAAKVMPPPAPVPAPKCACGDVCPCAAKVVEGPIRDRLRERIALRIIKTKTIEKATTTGVNGKKLSRADAEAAYERMEKDLGDDGILAAAKEAAPPIAGKLAGGPLTDFLDWLLANAPAIIELLMKILPLFLA